MIEITLAVSDPVYQQAAQLAQRTNRPVEEVLADTLEQAFSPFGVDACRPIMQQEEAAFEAMRATLWEQFPNQYVALHQGQVIDHDSDQVLLVQRVRQKIPRQQVVLFRQVTAVEPPPLRFRSPRFLEG